MLDGASLSLSLSSTSLQPSRLDRDLSPISVIRRNHHTDKLDRQHIYHTHKCPVRKIRSSAAAGRSSWSATHGVLWGGLPRRRGGAIVGAVDVQLLRPRRPDGAHALLVWNLQQPTSFVFSRFIRVVCAWDKQQAENIHDRQGQMATSAVTACARDWWGGKAWATMYLVIKSVSDVHSDFPSTETTQTHTHTHKKTQHFPKDTLTRART